jgi:hypothetical protein
LLQKKRKKEEAIIQQTRDATFPISTMDDIILFLFLFFVKLRLFDALFPFSSSLQKNKKTKKKKKNKQTNKLVLNYKTR